MHTVASIKKSKQSGFAMLEVLVASIVFAIGVSGIGVLLLTTIQGTQDNAQRSQGMWIVQDFVGRMRANPDGAKSGGYRVSANPDCESPPVAMCAEYIDRSGDPKPAATCSPLDMATFDVWVTMCGFDDPTETNPAKKIFDSPAEFVSNPTLTSTCGATNTPPCVQYTIELTWNTKVTQGAAAADDRINQQTYNMVVELN